MKTWQKIKANPPLLDKYLIRERVIDIIRSFFKTRGFHEAQTPVLVPVPSVEANLEVFETQLVTAKNHHRRAFLIMSPEYALKKLLVAGIGKVFEITRCFRNEEEVSGQHNTEFTMLEWYRPEADYTAIMMDIEALFTEIIRTIRPDADLSKWVYQNQTYDLSLPWPRFTVAQVFEKYAGITEETLLTNELLLAEGKKRGYAINDNTTWEQVFYQIFFNEIEPEIKSSGKPMIIYDYPLSQAALARKKAKDPRFAERFELFLAGLELGNCFSELTDPKEQRERMIKDLAERKQLGKTQYGIDEDLIEALKAGLPPTAGIAVGVDRLIMLAADVSRISDTLFFPAQELFDL